MADVLDADKQIAIIGRLGGIPYNRSQAFILQEIRNAQAAQA